MCVAQFEVSIVETLRWFFLLLLTHLIKFSMIIFRLCSEEFQVSVSLCLGEEMLPKYITQSMKTMNISFLLNHKHESVFMFHCALYSSVKLRDPSHTI